MPTRNQLGALMAQVEEMWGHLETLFDKIEAADGWGQKHGPDWTFADVPYHCAYINREVIARGLGAGRDLHETEQVLLATPEAVHAWNAGRFAERPAGQTAAESVAQWRGSCEEIRRLVSRMDDSDLERPCFLPIMRGWVTVRDALKWVCDHDWSEFMQLRIHMGLNGPVPSPEITRDYLGTMLGLFPMFLNQEAAAGREFSTVMAFTDPGVGAWTIRVADGIATLSEGVTADADLVMTQSAEIFEKSIRRIHDPAEAIQSGAIQVSDFEALGTFGQLFPM